MNMKPNLTISDLMKYSSPNLTKKEWFDFAKPNHQHKYNYN